MKVKFPLALLFILILLSVFSLAAAQRGYPKLAPFQNITWPRGYGQPPVITLDGERYELLVINNLYIEDVVEFSAREYREQWQKRIAEDLVQVLSEMDTPPGKTVSMLVRVPGKEETLELTDVPMNKENRDLLQDALERREEENFSSEAMLEDLDLFQEALETRFAYLHANDFDYQSNLDALRQEVETGLSLEKFGLGLERIVTGFIDGHAGISGYRLSEDLAGQTPFLMGWTDERVVAFEANRTSFVDKAHPYVIAIDGVPLEKWLEAASQYVADGSPQLVRRRTLESLRSVQLYREALGLPLEPTLTLTLTSGDGESVERTLSVSKERPRYGDWPERDSQILEGNIGYLRIEDMDDEAVEEIQTWLPQFENTKGLIVDVRDNGGGTRDALIKLFPYLVQEENAIVNVAKYRLSPGFDEDHLASRFLYRADSPHWNDPEREVVEAFAASFEPEWCPPEEGFSAWHYLLIRRGDAEPYTAPVVVLLDAGGFSATDIFLGALATLPNVTLIGEASSGGSARAQEVTLPNTGLEIKLASMASFRPDGRLFDGRGVEPDIEVQPEPSFFLQGGKDVVLERAVEVVSSGKR